MKDFLKFSAPTASFFIKIIKGVKCDSRKIYLFKQRDFIKQKIQNCLKYIYFKSRVTQERKKM